jgi:hypothetical protein
MEIILYIRGIMLKTNDIQINKIKLEANKHINNI